MTRYGWNALEQNPWKAENMYKVRRSVLQLEERLMVLQAIRANNPDLLGAQEVVDYMVEEIAGHIGGDYQVGEQGLHCHMVGRGQLHNRKVFFAELQIKPK